MSQFNFGTIVASTKSGSGLAADLNAWRDAVHSNHKGAARPTYKLAGMSWINDVAAPWVDYVYDGVNDTLRGFIDPVSHRYSTAGNFARTIPSGGVLLHLADWGTLFNFTGAAAQTVAIDAKATLLAGWWVRIVAASVTVTIDPYGAETVDGVTSLIITSGTTITLFYDGTNLYTDNMEGGAFPIGGVIHVPANTPPTGFLRMNGALLSRTTYANLWGFAQTSANIVASDGVWTEGHFSPGDGTTTFRIPDGRGSFMRNWDDARGVDPLRAVGSLQQDAIETHAHTAYTDAQGQHQHNVYGGLDVQGAHQHYNGEAVLGGNIGGSGMRSNMQYPQYFVYTSVNGAHGHNLSGAYADAQGSHGHNITVNPTPTVPETRPRNIALLACIKF